MSITDNYFFADFNRSRALYNTERCVSCSLFVQVWQLEQSVELKQTLLNALNDSYHTKQVDQHPHQSYNEICQITNKNKRHTYRCCKALANG